MRISKMFKKRWVLLSLVTGVLALAATPAFANHIDSATVTPGCSSYTIELKASALSVGTTYKIDWTITGLGPTINGSITFTASSTTFDSGPITKPIGPLSGDFTPSGTATLEGRNTVSISFSPTSISCPGPPVCSVSTTSNSNFNGTRISGGNFIWFNANFTASGIPSTGATLSFTNSTISFTANGVAHTLTVPNATINFSPTATCASTTFEAGAWVTTVPISGSDEIFLTGLAFEVPSGGLPGGINPVSWTGTFDSNKHGVSMSWKWGAAVYTTFSTNYNSLMVKPTHSNACGISNSDHAGTPEAFKAFVTGGARGGGGSNFTGSWSGTQSVKCP